MDIACFAVNDPRMALDGHPVDVPQTLMAQADAQDWHPPGEPFEDFVGHTRFGGRTRAGRNDHAFGLERLDLVRGEFVVADHSDLERAVEFADPVDEIPREAVVVVNDEDHGCPAPQE